MPITAPPGQAESTTQGGQLATKELRLAVVCFGGVSLAIYMHGATKELQSLFRASQAYAADPHRNPWADAADKTERAYWEAFKEAQTHDKDVATRVAIDIVSGTSAGGINGIVLAKALSRGASQDRLRDVWLDQGSILKLANPFTGTRGPLLHRIKSAASAMWKARRGPLNGDFLLRNVYDALEAMETPASGNGHGGNGGGESPWPMELHVTLTDITGFPQAAPAWDPKVVRDVRHGYELVFRRDPRRLDQFERDDNRALAFAARATSSFPGAFPPTRIADLEALDAPWDGRAKFLERYWAPYALSETDATATEFMDGGVLDNAPFGLAIDAIDRQPATSQVDRKLLYIQPDPRDPQLPARPSRNGILGAAWGAMSTIPRKEPIVRDLLEVRRRNDRIERANDVIKAAEAGAKYWPPPGSAEDLGAIDEDLHETMGADPAAACAYRQLKLFTVVDRLAEIASGMLNFPPESGHALFVKDVLVAWARETELLDSRQWQARQLPFLKDFDLSYRERRIRFVIDRINSQYADHPEPEQRAHLDALKQALYQRVWDLSALGEAARASDEAAGLRTIFAKDEVRARLARDDDPKTIVEQFAKDRRTDLERLRAGLGSFLNQRLEHFTRDTYQLILDATEPWGNATLRTDVRRRYAMFPRYDALLFPIRALSDLGELDPVEVIRLSPLDSRLVPVPGAGNAPSKVSDKLEGDEVGHFAAFLARPKRETDYLWGRLDAVERLIPLLVGERASKAYTVGFRAVVEGEAESLTHIDKVMEPLRKAVRELPDQLAVQRIRAPAAS